MHKLLDLRFVIGVFFLVTGILLLAYSFFVTDAIDNASTVNRWCGSAFAIFGVIMVILSFGKNAHDELK